MDINSFQSNLDRCVDHLLNDLSQIHTGRATVELIEDVKVIAYGTTMVMKSVGNITVSDSRSLLVQPWDKGLLEVIEKSISSSNLGFSASREGDYVRITIPELNEERRKEFVKLMKEKVEMARVSVRNVRQEFMKEVDSMVSSGVSEDEGKRAKEEAEKRVKATNEKIEEIRDKKEKELMTI